MDWSSILTAGGLFESSTMFWLATAVLLLILEIFTSGFFLGALAVSAGVTSVLAALGWSHEVQIVGFSVVSIASLIWARPAFVRLLAADDLPTNAGRLVGQRGTVTTQVPPDGVGRVRLSNEDWRATCGEQLEVGQPVRVAKVEGNTLAVERV